MTTPNTERQSEIKKFLDLLFEGILEVFAETDCFSNEPSPSIFLVYAHKNPSVGKAYDDKAVQLIKWLKDVRSKAFSDKSLVPGLWATREEKDDASVHDILSNQFCLLPERSRVAKGKKVTSVNKVILCCSEVLQSYSEDTRMHGYTNELKDFYSKAEGKHQDIEAIREGIQTLIRHYRNKEGFHHVITELAFLDIRSSRGESRHDIIPVVFNGNGIEYLRYFDKAQTVWLKVKNDPLMLHPCQGCHKLFFQVLRRLYEKQERSISELQTYYEECIQSLLSQESLPPRETFMAKIESKKLKTLDRLIYDAYATCRVLLKDSPQQLGLSSVPFGGNPNFVGRESLIKDIDEKLTSSEYCQRVALWGLGGIGKTQIALEYARRRRKATPGCAIFWIPAISVATFEKAYLEIGKLLEIPGISDAKADVKSLVQEKLNDERTGEWLIIVDNADDGGVLFHETSPGTLRLIDFLPSSPKGSIIFTTRTRSVAVEQVSAQDNRIEVAEMSKIEAKDLLKKILGETAVDQEPEAIDELLNLLAQLPLAIIQAASFIAKTAIQLVDYISMFKSSETDTIKMLSENFEDLNRYREMKNPVATTWLISFEQIRKEDPLAARYLSFMACLLRENIPQSLLPEEKSAFDKTQAIGTLAAYSFLTRKESTHMFEMHRLVHLVTRNWLKDQKQLAIHTDNTLLRVSALPYGGHEDNKIWAEYLPHVIYIAASSKESDKWQARAELLDKTGQCQRSLGQYRASEETCRQVFDLYQTRLGVNHSWTLTSMNNLSLALKYQGKYTEAEKIYRETLTLLEKVSGKERSLTLSVMNNLSSALSDQGKYTEAEKMCREMLALLEKVFRKEHPETLNVINSLSIVLSKHGKYTEAEKMYREMLALLEKVFRKEHPDTLSIMNSLSLVLSDQEKYEEAEKIYWKTLTLLEKVSGKEHPSTLSVMNNLSSALSDQGKYTEAEKMYRETLALREKVSGKEHPQTLILMNNLSLTLSYQRRYTEAEKMYRETLTLREKLSGKEHPETLTVMNNLSSTLSYQRKYTEAEKMYQETLALREKVLGKEHPKTLTVMNNLSSVLSNQGKYVEAEMICRETLALREKVSGKEHPDTLVSIRNLKYVVDKQKKNALAEDIRQGSSST